ncbi:MAG: hypothetical protein JW940_28735 [Polyangiaceae bacterium]|nr:hypothetical protein [Polyangiaceae bacterium]
MHLVLAAALYPSAAAAAPAEPPAATAPSSPSTQPAADPTTCIERIPSGRPRPKLTERIADKALSGHLVTLQVTVEHGKAETVFPGGLRLQFEGDAARALEKSGFALPMRGGSAEPSLKVAARGNSAVTTVDVPLLVLADQSGRHELVLPALPISVARASGDVATVCTEPHRIVVDEPIANEPHPRPRNNPPARPQREVWEALQRVVLGSLVGLLVAALIALAIRAWRRRPRRAPPPPPPRPPWEVALEELFDIRNADLVRSGRHAEHFDRVSDVARKYLGNVFGYDGLESTTRETLHNLRTVRPRIAILSEIEQFLLEADLVKFARQVPSEPQCESALSRAEEIVQKTRPAAQGAHASPPSPPSESQRGEAAPAAAEPPDNDADDASTEPAASARAGGPQP